MLDEVEIWQVLLFVLSNSYVLQLYGAISLVADKLTSDGDLHFLQSQPL